MLQLLPNTKIRNLSASLTVLSSGKRRLKLRFLSAAEKELLKHLLHPWKLETFHALAFSLGLDSETTTNLLQILQQHQFLRQFATDYDISLLTKPAFFKRARPDFKPQAVQVLIEVAHLQQQSDVQALAPLLTTLTDLLTHADYAVFVAFSGAYPVRELPVKLQALLAKDSTLIPDLVVQIAPTPDVAAAQVWQELGVPLLSVFVFEDEVQVGPLVKPHDAPCLQCLELFKAEYFLQLGGFEEAVPNFYPALAPSVMVAAAAQAANACTQMAAGHRLLPGEVRFVDAELLVERTLWPFNPQCANHPLALPAVS